jgi:hypothetical protein
MKKILYLLTGVAAVMTFGLAQAAETMPAPIDSTDKMIRNDDLLRYNLDQDRGTINQLPALPGADVSGAEGSAAGGVRNDTDTLRDENISKTPADKPVEKSPGEGGAGTGVLPTVPNRYGY